MEIKNLSQDLTSSFSEWNEGEDSASKVESLNKAIRFASENGIELTFTIPKGLLDSKAVTKPIFRADAIEHSSGTAEHSIMFDVPSESGMNRVGASKKLTLEAVEKYRDLGTVLLLKHKTKGVIGAFIPGEISSLDLK